MGVRGGGRPAAAGAGVAAGHPAGHIRVEGGVEAVVGRRTGGRVALVVRLLECDIVFARRLERRREAEGFGPLAQAAHHRDLGGQKVLSWLCVRKKQTSCASFDSSAKESAHRKTSRERIGRGPKGPRIEIRGGELET